VSPSDVDPDSESYDILDETLSLFRANTFFRNFEIKGPADRLLIYGILFLSDCLNQVKANMDARSAEKALVNGALEQFAIPGDTNFPLNQAFEAPNDRMQVEQLRGYLSQVRQELAMRLLQRLYEGGNGPSKVDVALVFPAFCSFAADVIFALQWWLSFRKREFMGRKL
jgi:actin related protein 2/3 complex, subunit 3